MPQKPKQGNVSWRGKGSAMNFLSQEFRLDAKSQAGTLWGSGLLADFLGVQTEVKTTL